jgi:hypothetical protein
MRIKRLAWLMLCLGLLVTLGAPTAGAESSRRSPGGAMPAVVGHPLVADAPNRPIVLRIEGFVAKVFDEVPGELVVQVYDSGNVRDVGILVTKETILSQDPAITPGDPLRVGDLVIVRATFDGTQYVAQSIHILARRKPIEFRGIIEDIGTSPFIVDNQKCQWIRISGTDVYICNRDPVVPAQLHYYARVKGFLEPNGKLRADDLEILGHPRDIARRFEYQGALRALPNIPGSWVIGPFTGWVDHATEISGSMVLGAIVEVHGQRLEDGTLRFDTIRRVDTDAFVRLQGIILKAELQRGRASVEGYLYIESEDRRIVLDTETLLDESAGRLAPGMWAEVVARPFGETILEALRVRISRSG